MNLLIELHSCHHYYSILLYTLFIKRLKMYLQLQATFVFFCATSVVQIIFLLILIS